MTTHITDLMGTLDEKEEHLTKIIKNILDTIDGEDYESICFALCYTVASQIDYFVKKNKVEEFLDNFKTATLKALNEIRDIKNTIH